MPRVSLVAATEELARRDQVMARLIELGGPCKLRALRSADFFVDLAESIVYQQLATGAAAAIWKRVAALFPRGMTPGAVLRLPEQDLRGAGLSTAKAASLRDLASKVADGTVPLDDIRRLRDEEIVARLVTVRGIGEWTAQMFLIFTLRRLDVWPTLDYGVRSGYARAYGLPEVPSPKQLLPEGERFVPFRTVAAWYCWRAVHLKLPMGSPPLAPIERTRRAPSARRVSPPPPGA